MCARQLRAIGIDDGHDPEVNHLPDDVAVLIAMAGNVPWLQIAVHDAPLVRQLQGTADRTEDLLKVQEVELATSTQLLSEAGPVQILHDQVRLALRTDVEIQDGDDVGMTKGRDCPAFAQEPFAHDVSFVFGGTNDFDGDFVAEQEALCAKDLAHAAGAQTAEHLVAAAEDCPDFEHMVGFYTEPRGREG